MGFGIVEHAAGSAGHTIGRVQFAASGSGEQRFVGHGIPERVRQPARGGVGARFGVGGVFQVEEKVRRLQHRFDDDLRAGGEVGLLLKEGLVSVSFHRGEQPRKGVEAEALDKCGAACREGGQVTGLCALPGRKAARASFSAAAL